MKLGVDIGTSVAKAALFDDDGTCLRTETRHTPIIRLGSGRFEHDVDQLIDVVLLLLGGVGRQAAGALDAIAVTGQGDGLWLTDERGRSVRNAVSWLDARASAVCESWAASGAIRQAFNATGNAPFSGAGAAILAYFNSHEPDVLDQSATATQCQHVLFQRLTAERAASRSCAMLPVFDPHTGNYDDDVIESLGLMSRRDLLPAVAAGPAYVAELRDDVADALHLPRKIPVATGPYDLPAAALGAGVSEHGDGLLTLGTTLACQVLHDVIDTTGPAVGLTLCAGDGNGWLRAMPAMVGTAGLDWVLQLVGAKYTELGALLSRSVAGANGVHALPYLSPGGERAPFVEHQARGSLEGLSIESTPADVVRSYCEALGYAARHCFDAAGLRGKITACGGGVASAELMQLFADIMGRPLWVALSDEPAARGAVKAAALALGLKEGNRVVVDVIEPDERQADYYANEYGQYLTRVEIARARWSRGPGTPNGTTS
jgi:erythritol kinase (D-erythritol 1-phosphate-forming)